MWSFLNAIIYDTAIECAKDSRHQDIVDLLSKGPIKADSKQADSLINKNRQLEEENARLKEENSQFKIEVNRLTEFLFALKEKTSGMKFFNFDDYKDESVIGEGATSSVKLVSKKEKEKYAKKELKDFTHKTIQRFLGEGEILFLFHHPCIVDIIAVNYGDETHPPSLILSLEPKSLERVIESKELDDKLKCRITTELVLGMRYIHSRNFMHRDLKPSNILLSKNNHVRISDFGLAREEDLETSQSKGVGTLRFMAPELFVEDEDGSTKYTNKVDVYSFGITLIYVVTGGYPRFNMRNAVNGVLPKLSDTIVSWVRDLIQRCLSFEPEKRPSFSEIFELLKLNNFDLFSESNGKNLTSKQQSMKIEIEKRVLKIEAFEFQHQND